jgi:hypothetical protein
VNRGGRWAGRGLMTTGTILTVIGLGIILVKTVRLPGYWMPFIVGVGLLLAGLIVWATSRDSSP